MMRGCKSRDNRDSETQENQLARAPHLRLTSIFLEKRAIASRISSRFTIIAYRRGDMPISHILASGADDQR
jgi:hypothetical protein